MFNLIVRDQSAIPGVLAEGANMIDFTTVPANTRSIAYRSLVYGVGTNDAPYKISQKVNGRVVSCKYYTVWKSMLERSYSDKCHKINPTYIGCSVCSEWLYFMAFKAWMIQQQWEGRQLDKDILTPGNKVYSEENCVFVHANINTLLNDSEAGRGKFPVGVTFQKVSLRFRAMISKNGKRIHIGCYETIEQASTAYRIAKSAHVKSIALEQSDPRIKAALLNHAAIIMSGSSHFKQSIEWNK